MHSPWASKGKIWVIRQKHHFFKKQCIAYINDRLADVGKYGKHILRKYIFLCSWPQSKANLHRSTKSCLDPLISSNSQGASSCQKFGLLWDKHLHFLILTSASHNCQDVTVKSLVPWGPHRELVNGDPTDISLDFAHLSVSDVWTIA